MRPYDFLSGVTQRKIQEARLIAPHGTVCTENEDRPLESVGEGLNVNVAKIMFLGNPIKRNYTSNTTFLEINLLLFLTFCLLSVGNFQYHSKFEPGKLHHLNSYTHR